MVIIYFLCHETLRFSQLKRKMPQVTEANLTKELSMLEQYGLVYRKYRPRLNTHSQRADRNLSRYWKRWKSGQLNTNRIEKSSNHNIAL